MRLPLSPARRSGKSGQRTVRSILCKSVAIPLADSGREILCPGTVRCGCCSCRNAVSEKFDVL